MSGHTRTGLDVLAAEGCGCLKGRRVGLITNHTGITRERRHVLDVLLESGVEVVALFGPEHGIRGDHDETFKVASSIDPQTGLPVHSLFSTVQRPTDEMLAGVETLVFDIADAGVRYYTYTTTMAWCMEEAAKRGIGFVVLDRPNPITGTRVEGPILAPAFQSLSAYHAIPTRHGLTAGELARYANAEYGIGCELQVVQCQGWRREWWFDETGLPWTNPSPNLRNLNQLTLYAVLCGVEASRLAVGRGTDSPFEVFGAPWMDGQEVAARLNDLTDWPLRFVGIEFTPRSHVFEGERCGGCFLLTLDRERLRPVEANIHLACELVRLYPGKLDILRSQHLLGGPHVAEAVAGGVPATEIIARWQEATEDWGRASEGYLLYP
jgi:uncharacterized protein YbbC (DUF1343 family)